MSEIIPEGSLHVGTCFFLQIFPTKIGCKLTDKIRLLNLMFGNRLEPGALCLVSLAVHPVVALPRNGANVWAPRASDIAFSDGAT